MKAPKGRAWPRSSSSTAFLPFTASTLSRCEGLKPPRDLLSQLETFENGLSPAPRGGSLALSSVSGDRRDALTAIAESFNSRGPFRVSVEDIIAVLNAGDAHTRAALFDNGLAALRD